MTESLISAFRRLSANPKLKPFAEEILVPFLVQLIEFVHTCGVQEDPGTDSSDNPIIREIQIASPKLNPCDDNSAQSNNPCLTNRISSKQHCGETSNETPPPQPHMKNEHVRRALRGKARNEMNGFACTQCEQWFTMTEMSKMHQDCKHKFDTAPPTTPPGYWDVGFPSTQKRRKPDGDGK